MASAATVDLRMEMLLKSWKRSQLGAHANCSNPWGVGAISSLIMLGHSTAGRTKGSA